MTIFSRVFAIALCASASLTPARGQQPQQVVGTCASANGTSQCSFPQVLVGTDQSDATKTWTTVFRIFNRGNSPESATLQIGTGIKVIGRRPPIGTPIGGREMAIIRPPMPVRPGQAASAEVTLPAFGVWCGTPSFLEATMATPTTVTLTTTTDANGSPDVIGEAFVVQKDTNGNVRQSYFVGDASQFGNVPGKAFAAVITVGNYIDTVAILSNPSSIPAVVTVTVWNGTTEVATTMVTIPANATTSWTVGSLFVSSPSYQNFVTLNGVGSARMTITSPSSFAGGVTQVNMNPDKTALSAMGFLFPAIH